MPILSEIPKLMLSTHHISFEKTGYFAPIVLDYLNADEKLKEFYSFAPTLDGLKQAAEKRKFSKEKREILVKVLTEQWNKTEIEDHTVDENLSKLLQSNTFTVTTGHQLNIFTGPLYFIYKIVSAINLAAKLNSEIKDKHFVPVYWMASEDHDFAEINNVDLYGKRVEWKNNSSGAVGKLSTNSFSTVIKELENTIGTSREANDLISLFKECYSENSSLAEATSKLVYHLFKNKGLIVIDADNHELKKLFYEVIKDELINNKTNDLVEEQVEKLNKNFKIQVNPREINLFYLKDNLRERIVKQNNRWKVLNTNMEFDENTLLKEIETHPERFSPNVLLRPLYQEIILPNIAYIGGGAEIAYWLELKNVFAHYSVQKPVVLLRNSVEWIDERSAERMTKLGIDSEDLFLEKEKLIKKIISQKFPEELSIEKQKQQLNKIYNELIEKGKSIDPTLKASFKADLHRNIKMLEHAQHKILKAIKRKNNDIVQHVEKLKKTLFPKGVLQERKDNFIPYYIKYENEFLNNLFKDLDPLDFRFVLIKEEKEN
ncbi:MAG: bacillithiol biosynthesis cysteine-adding enzyme BshC [Bacteroidia bacterium]